MKRSFILLLTLFITANITFAYSVKVYDEMGNRVGTYKKENGQFVLYDFNDNKVEDPSTLMQRQPSQQALNYYTQYLYTENMQPIAPYASNFYRNAGRYYRGFRYPSAWYQHSSGPAIVVPSVGEGFTVKEKNSDDNIENYHD